MTTYWEASVNFRRNIYFMACMAIGPVVLFAVSRWGLVRDALK